MIEHDFEKLMTVIERIAVAVEKLAPKDAFASTAPAKGPVDKVPDPEPALKAKKFALEVKKPEPEPEAADNGITYEEMYCAMFEIAQASSKAKKMILPMLESYGYNHVQKVKPEHYAEIHAKLLTIATRIAKGEID